MLGRRNLLQTIKYAKLQLAQEMRHVLGGFGEYLGSALRVVPVSVSFLRHLLWATVGGHSSGLE